MIHFLLLARLQPTSSFLMEFFIIYLLFFFLLLIKAGRTSCERFFSSNFMASFGTTSCRTSHSSRFITKSAENFVRYVRSWWGKQKSDFPIFKVHQVAPAFQHGWQKLKWKRVENYKILTEGRKDPVIWRQSEKVDFSYLTFLLFSPKNAHNNLQPTLMFIESDSMKNESKSLCCRVVCAGEKERKHQEAFFSAPQVPSRSWLFPRN